MNRRIAFLVGAAILLLAGCQQTSDPASRRRADVVEVFHSEQSNLIRPGEPVDMGYLLWVPDGYDPARTYPLLIFLHGSGGNGEDIQAYADVTRRPAPLEDQADAFPYLVLMPQSPTGIDWTDELAVLDDLLDHVVNTYPVDTSRIYLTGYSMGGAGVWGWGAYAPDRFAALVPVAGYWNINSATALDLKICSLADTPVYTFHSKDDMNVGYTLTSGLVSTLERCGGSGDITFKTFRGISHYTTLSRAMGDVKLYRWLDEQTLGS
jgi:predicted peptidase